ncbi:hypothetical protein ACE38W_00480 [Chitinophaga sp. Hz27]|uniref:hypothetical protein n=1 Tax=Chitinophaga sp. Hz27 TaxID=3347169 RepID=UPI0035DBAE06
MTELDKKLQEYALMNWPYFVQLIGEEAVLKAKTCLLRQNNASYTAIAIKLGITEKQARLRCDKCEEK